MRYKNLLIAIGASLAAHMAFIPLLSIYGVHVCPVLNGRGFGFGCKYNAAFVFVSLFTSGTINLCLFYLLKLRTEKGFNNFSLREFAVVSGLVHFAAFIVSLYFLREYLEQLQLPAASLIRMTAALAISAILLALLQAEIFGYVIQKSLREDNYWRGLSDQAQKNAMREAVSSKMLQRWFLTEISRSAPYWACLAIVLIYGVSKISEINELYGLDAQFLESRGREAAQILGLVLLWLSVIQILKMFRERDLLKDLNNHVTKLGLGHVDQFSREVATGIWQELFQFLNRVTLSMAQRLRLIKGLSAYAASTVVDNVLHKDELHTFGNRKKIAILMSDLRGFTEMSNNLEPEAVVRILNLYFEAMIDVCTKNGLVVDKFIGDGLLAYVDAAQGETAASQCAKALHASHEMLLRLDQLNIELKSLGLQELRIGIGLHFGDVVVGSIGSKDRLQHTIIGDAVNTAARLEAQCKNLEATIVASKVLVAEAQTAENHEAWPSLKSHGAITVRGLALPLEVFVMPNAYRSTISAA